MSCGGACKLIPEGLLFQLFRYLLKVPYLPTYLREGVPHLASRDLVALPLLLPSSRLLATITNSGYSLPVSMNTPLYPALF